MPFITSLGRRPCNDCRRVPVKGSQVYQGEHTGMIWCLPCASSALHKTPGAAETPRGSVLPAGWARFQAAAVQAWTERED